MDRLSARVLTAVCVLISGASARGAAPPDAELNLVQSIGRSAASLLEIATRFAAEEKLTVRNRTGPDTWNVQETVSEFRYSMSEGGLHERRRVRTRSGPNAEAGIRDLSQVILLFVPATLNRYSFRQSGTGYIGAARAVVFEYEQRDGPESLAVRDGRKRSREPIHGKVWVSPDSAGVLRVSLETTRPKNIRDQAEVDYATGEDRATVPVSAVHKEFEDGVLVSETSATYKRLPDARP